MPKVMAQLAIDERVLEDAELDAALERRLRAGDDLSEVRKVFSEADKVAKGLLEAIGLAEGEVIRVGRFRVEKKSIAAKAVSFETDATTRLSIGVIDE